MLIVRNPRPSFDSFDRMFDQLTSSWFAPTPGARTRASMPHVQAEWDDGSLVLTVDLPGVPREAVKVEVAERTLTVAVEHASDRGELRWSRTLQLGGSLDADRVAARYVDGRLTVTVPPAAKPQPRTIAIEGAAEVPAVESGATEAIEVNAEG